MRLSRRWAGLGVFLGVAAVFIHTSAPAATPGDAGEFIAAVATFSLPHAPSFPLYLLVSHLFVSLVPFASVVHRVVLFSAVCGAGATVLLFLAIDTASGHRLASVACALAAAFSAPVWLNSIVAEVFALHAMLITGFLYLLAASAREDISVEKAAVLFGFLGGVAASNHQAVAFVAPAYGILACLIGSRGRCLRVTFLASLFAVFGLTLFLALPIRSSKNPPLNWGRPTTPERLYRTIMRKDYGTLSLALGEMPERSVENTARQIGRFAERTEREAGWPLVAAGLVGLLIGLRRREPLAAAAAAIFLFSGPLFFLIGNLPFDAQSDGITQRFYITPILALALGAAMLIRSRPRWGGLLAAASVVLTVWTGRAEACAVRSHHLVPDFADAMLRAVPANGALFLDGGDDAFYGIATELYARDRRPDFVVHDRGGLVFPNAYGDDFRALTPEEKALRRVEVEKAFIPRGPLYYNTMNKGILPGVPMVARGFLLEANGRGSGFDWPLVCVRSIYPTPTCDYRTRALAAYFPYMRGLSLVDSSPEQSLRCLRRAAFEAGDALWMRGNLPAAYAEAGNAWLLAGRLPWARQAFSDWIEYDGGNEGAFNNLGVVAEREGNLEEAKRWYRLAAERFPSAADPVYNLAVLDWKRGDWPSAAVKFAEVLRRRPDHPTAGRFLIEAEHRMGRKI